jgi:hypothetical protein
MQSKRIVKPSFKVKNGAAAPRKSKVDTQKRQASSEEEESSSDNLPRGPSQKRSKHKHVAPEEVSDCEVDVREAEVINLSEEEVSVITPQSAECIS